MQAAWGAVGAGVIRVIAPPSCRCECSCGGDNRVLAILSEQLARCGPEHLSPAACDWTGSTVFFAFLAGAALGALVAAAAPLLLRRPPVPAPAEAPVAAAVGDRSPPPPASGSGSPVRAEPQPAELVLAARKALEAVQRRRGDGERR